ncbi:MAG: TraR/DksA family transcriptional regulator [Planctomycetes bacterium]|nr:TraR/DksA family transcriptional regulator [Planctomycetota bacterium]
MARKDALVHLHKALVERRDTLLRRLGGDLKDLRQNAGDTGDEADQAFESSGGDVSSQLAEIEARELMQIERALHRLKQGTYGMCENCQKKIPVARLNALPFSTTCIQCQRDMENYGHWDGNARGVDWENLSDSEARMKEPRDVDLSQLEMDLSK